jgi:hypothetical protein
MANKDAAPAEYVKYVGTSHVREITADDIKGVGIKDQKPLRWDAANNWQVPRGDVSDDLWPYIDGDSGFIVVDAHGKDTKATKGENTHGLIQLNTGAPPGGPTGATSQYTGSGGTTGGGSSAST